MLGTMRGAFLGWGALNIAVYLVFFLLPYGWGGWPITFLRVSQLLWLAIVSAFAKIPFRVCFPVAIVVLLQLWSIFTMFHAWMELGRPARMGRTELYLWEGLLLFFQAAGLVYIEPSFREKIRLGILAVFSLSCFVGILQFLRFPPAIALSRSYTYKSIDFWDNTPGIRAVGLTFHPRELAFEAMVCFALVGCMAFSRKLKRIEIVGLVLYTGVMLSTQARGFYPAILVMWIVVGVAMLKTDLKRIITVAAVGIALFVVAVNVAPNRFGYFLQSTSLEQDASYQFRADGPWQQLQGIYTGLPWTGIGPDPLMFLGAGQGDRKWGTYGIMESAYRVFLAMYGIPGFMLLIVGLAGTIIAGALTAFNPRETPLRRALGGVAIIVVGGLAFNGHSTNTFDGYMQFPVAMMIAGIYMRSREEENAMQRRVHGADGLAVRA